MFDVCHLIKNVRNTVLKNDIETPDGIASWGVVKQLYKYERVKTTRLCPKLSDRHVYTNNFDKQKVRFATQVLSHSCSAAIKTLYSIDKSKFGEYHDRAESTAIFKKKMDKLFDCLNSKAFICPKKPFRSALTLNSDITAYLIEIRDYIKEIKTKFPVFC